MRATLISTAFLLACAINPAGAQTVAMPTTAATKLLISTATASTNTSATLPTYAIVAQDQIALRAGPHDNATTQAVLWQGDALEVRGQRLDYLQVYDHRRERAGYVRATQVRTTHLKAEDAPELQAVLRFVRDTPGTEALGLAYGAAYLKAAAAGVNTAEAWDAMGQMAERLARRASKRQNLAMNGNSSSTPTAQDTQLAGQLEGLAAYGVKLQSFERDGNLQLCYDGEAFGRVLTQSTSPATPEQTARAVLGLTRLDCQDPNTTPTTQHSQDLWRAKLLESAFTAPAFAQLPDIVKNRVQLRRASLWSALAFQHNRQGHGDDSHNAANYAITALAAINKAELSDDDITDWTQAAVRVGASRWAVLPPPAMTVKAVAQPHIVTRPGQPGETCVLLVDAKHDDAHPLHSRCTYGTVWSASANLHPQGQALALAVQPLSAWRELWLYRQTAEGWTLEVLPPGTGKPELGYVEFAGWVPGDTTAARMLVAREAQTDGRIKRSFEVLRLDTLAIDKQASTPSLLAAFGKWQDAGWKGMTVSVR